MTSYGSVCSLCFDDVEEKDLVLNQSIQDMLGTLLIHVDISVAENALICRTCRRKLENHCGFKKKCIFTEDILRPFVAENVKMNLNEIYKQIIKSEVKNEKNVCRLCLQHCDDDMTLNGDETLQFQVLFPEINLNLTNFMILCLTCYNMLHKYFMFVTSFHSNQVFHKKSSVNAEESDEKNVLLLNENMGMKSEEDSSDFLEDKLDIGVEQIIDIKSEDTKPSSMDIEENDDIKPLLLQEELNIKSDEDSSEGQFLYIKSSSAATSIRLQPNRSHIENHRLEETNCDKITSTSMPKENCSNIQEDPVLIVHSNPSKMQMFKCEECSYETKHKFNLKRHLLSHRSNSFKTTMYKCSKCNYKSKWHSSLTRHCINKHTNLDEIRMYKCAKCDYKSKWRDNLKKHCISKHFDPAEIQMYECNECGHETKLKDSLKRHMLTHAAQFSEVEMYKCDKCDYESKWRNNLKVHFFNKHTDSSEIQMHKCKECIYEAKYKGNLKKHMLTHATNCTSKTTHANPSN